MNKKLGYYTVGNKEFFSKIQAMIYATETKLPLNWIFNDTVFNSFNWQHEPIETLDELYDCRARELREKYDYIILSYSGGSDSHNIFMSFYRQNLFIDEILVNKMDKFTEKYIVNDKNNLNPGNYSAEFYFQTAPRLQEIKNNCPRTKITVRDMSDGVTDFLTSATDGDWVIKKREVLQPFGGRYNYKYINEVRKTFDSNKKIGLIVGVEKPRVLIREKTNEVYLYFNDRASNNGVMDNLNDYDNNLTVEYFYWDPSCTRMLCKQGHVIKKWLEINTHMQPFWKSNGLSPIVILRTQERILRNLIYTTWDSQWYQVDKPVYDWHCEYADAFFANFKDSNLYHNWMAGIKYVIQNASDFVVYDETLKTFDKFKNSFKYYKIGELCSKI